MRINPHLMFTGLFLPRWLVVRPELSTTTMLVYAQLCWHANKLTGAAFPSQVAIAVSIGKKERAVRMALAELVKCGLIEQEQVGKGCTNRYYFLQHSWMQGENEVTGNFCRSPKVTGNIVSSDRQKNVTNIHKVAGPIVSEGKNISEGADRPARQARLPAPGRPAGDGVFPHDDEAKAAFAKILAAIDGGKNTAPH